MSKLAVIRDMLAVIRDMLCAAALLAAATIAPIGPAAANSPNAEPLPTIGQPKADPDTIYPSLFVINADSATLEGNVLTLSGVSTNSIVFADRPVRAAGHVTTLAIVDEWKGGQNSFDAVPPNATVSVFSSGADGVKDIVVVLKEPKLEGDKLTFTIDLLEGDLDGADGAAAVFIDIIGMPWTPLSYAGCARRMTRRAIWYGAVAHPYYHPYYHPYRY